MKTKWKTGPVVKAHLK